MPSGLESIAALLLSQQDDYKSTNPFYTSGSALLSMPPVDVAGTKMSPWTAVLAGALSGFSGGALQALGRRQGEAENADISTKLLEALSAEPAQRDSLLESDPKLSSYGALFKLNEAIDKKALSEYEKKQEIEALLKPRTMRSVINGTSEQQQEFDPLSHEWSNVGEGGPRFAPSSSEINSAIPPDVAQSLAGMAAKNQGLETADPSLVSTYSNARTAGLANALLGQGAAVDRSEAATARASRVSEKGALDLAEPLSIGRDIRKGIDQLNKVYKTEPDLLQKSFDKLPIGSDAYNAFKGLQVAGARSAKALEGRVNDTTLELYTDLLTSLNTEPLAATKKRAEAFVQSLRDDATTKASLIGAAGKDTSSLMQQIDRLLPEDNASQAAGASSAPPPVPEGYKLQQNPKTGAYRVVPK